MDRASVYVLFIFIIHIRKEAFLEIQIFIKKMDLYLFQNYIQIFTLPILFIEHKKGFLKLVVALHRYATHKKKYLQQTLFWHGLLPFSNTQCLGYSNICLFFVQGTQNFIWLKFLSNQRYENAKQVGRYVRASKNIYLFRVCSLSVDWLS